MITKHSISEPMYHHTMNYNPTMNEYIHSDAGSVLKKPSKQIQAMKQIIKTHFTSNNLQKGQKLMAPSQVQKQLERAINNSAKMTLMQPIIQYDQQPIRLQQAAHIVFTLFAMDRSEQGIFSTKLGLLHQAPDKQTTRLARLYQSMKGLKVISEFITTYPDHMHNLFQNQQGRQLLLQKIYPQYYDAMEAFLTKNANQFSGEQLVDILESPYGRRFCETLGEDDTQKLVQNLPVITSSSKCFQQSLAALSAKSPDIATLISDRCGAETAF